MKLRNSERLFGLDEDIDWRLPCVRSLIREEIWRLAKMYGFISKEIIFEQNMVTNGEPV